MMKISSGEMIQIQLIVVEKKKCIGQPIQEFFNEYEEFDDEILRGWKCNRSWAGRKSGHG